MYPIPCYYLYINFQSVDKKLKKQDKYRESAVQKERIWVR